jgi:hypothetical protein
MQHIFSKVEPYFHRQEKEMSYRDEVEHALLEMLMDTEIGENLNTEYILTIITETLESGSYLSESIGEYSKGQQKAYNEVLKKCAAFK